MINLFLFTHLLLQTAAHQALPDAASILDRYVKVTASPLDHNRKNSLFSIEFSVTDTAGTTYYATVYRDPNGHLHTAGVEDPDQRESGVAGGRVWVSSKQGARLLTGKAAEHVLAETHGLSAGSLADFAAGWGGGFLTDDWRQAFPTAKTVAQAVVHQQPCFEVLLTRLDGSTLRRWYEVKSGLLARETAVEFDQTGTEQIYETDVADYTTALGFTYPSVLHTKSAAGTFTVKINSFGGGGNEAYLLPRAVAQAIAKANTPEGMPIATDLIDRFAQLIAGGQDPGPIRSETMKANMSLGDANLKVPVVLYTAGRKSYFSLDIPTMGKFEFGSNGEVAWQRSVVMGPELLPRKQMGGMLGPDVTEILSWSRQGGDFRTVAKDAVNGAPCYVVEMDSGRPGAPAKACFDAKSGYLVRMERPAEGRTPAEQTTFSDYRNEGGFTQPHHVETMLAGKPVVIDISEVRFNVALPAHVFDLPEDVAALLQQEKEQAKPAAPDSAPRPSLRRRPQ